MHQPRKGKKSDHTDVEKAVKILRSIIGLNPQIESTLWSTALIFVLMKGYQDSEWSYAEFKEEVNQAFSHYRKYWGNL